MSRRVSVCLFLFCIFVVVTTVSTCHDPPPAGRDLTDIGLDPGPTDLADTGDAATDSLGDAAGETQPLTDDCSACHGDPDSAAPPLSVSGMSATSVRGVGAHREHLVEADWHRDVTCEACHQVPTFTRQPGHIDTPLPAEVIWGLLATADRADPLWDGQRCAGVYCHGATLEAQGSLVEPDWTTVDGTQAECGTCHALPPDLPHPVSSDCAGCHPTLDESLLFVDPDRHIDGVLDVSELRCDSCHGSDGDPSPPVDLDLDTETSERGVGAHRSHLGPSDWHATLACTECHQVPTAVDDPGHDDTPPPAELTWGELAAADHTDPSFDGERCADVYCHGATLADGTNTAPAWTVVDGTQAECGTCHGVPPGAPGHPLVDEVSPDCSVCHPYDGLVPLDPATHIDGVVDAIRLDCDSCHGGDGNAAPPVDLDGDVDRAAFGVGAHRDHLGVSDWHATVGCDECHQVPAELDAPGHRDSPPPAELIWGDLATAQRSLPQLEGSRCTDVYCHGATLTGGALTEPDWTGTSQTFCGSCHGLPPDPPDHPVVSGGSCGGCHLFRGFAPINPEMHINGEVDVFVSCDSCHGGDGVAAPPVDTFGNSDPSNPGVGAHRSHLGESDWHLEIACSECHQVPGRVEAAGHADTPPPAELVFGALADQDVDADYDFEANTCTVYCHGQTLPDGELTTPTWTAVGEGVAECDSCHGAPPETPPHPLRSDCWSCHPTMDGVDSFAQPDLHVDGQLQVNALGCDGCHGGGGIAAPPVDTRNNSDPSQTGVGAHRPHLGESDWHAEVQCRACHDVPGSIDDVGHADTPLPAEVKFNGVALEPGFDPDWTGTTCTEVYCHGATLDAGGAHTEPVWTGLDQAECGACHGVPPPSHAAMGVGSDGCQPCHPFDGLDPLDPSTHINGDLEVTAECGQCHAVPPDTGAHSRHYGYVAEPPEAVYGELTVVADVFPGGADYYLFGCGNCHPIDEAAHLDGEVQIELYDASAPAGSLKARNDPGAAYAEDGTCSGVYCHSSGQDQPLYVSSPPWDGSLAEPRCASCHGNPPNTPSNGGLDTDGDGIIDTAAPNPNTHVVIADDGWELGHFGGLPGPWHTSYHGGTSFSSTVSVTTAEDGGDYTLVIDIPAQRVEVTYHAGTGETSESIAQGITDLITDDPTFISDSDNTGDGLPDPYFTLAASVTNEGVGQLSFGSVTWSCGFGWTCRNPYRVFVEDPKLTVVAFAGNASAPITCQTCHYDTVDPDHTGPSGVYYLDTSGDYQLAGVCDFERTRCSGSYLCDSDADCGVTRPCLRRCVSNGSGGLVCGGTDQVCASDDDCIDAALGRCNGSSQTCASDADCPTRPYCEPGAGLPRSCAVSGDPCLIDTDCADGSACEVTSDEPDAGVCVGSTWRQCNSDADCDDGMLNYSCGGGAGGLPCHGNVEGGPTAQGGAILTGLHVNGERDVRFDPRETLPADAGGLLLRYGEAPNRPTQPYWVSAEPGVEPDGTQLHPPDAWSLTLAPSVDGVCAVAARACEGTETPCEVDGECEGVSCLPTEYACEWSGEACVTDADCPRPGASYDGGQRSCSRIPCHLRQTSVPPESPDFPVTPHCVTLGGAGVRPGDLADVCGPGYALCECWEPLLWGPEVTGGYFGSFKCNGCHQY